MLNKLGVIHNCVLQTSLTVNAVREHLFNIRYDVVYLKKSGDVCYLLTVFLV